MAIARGYAATDASKPLTPFTFERREPRDDDVVIEIKYCGVCHSDIHQARNEWGNSAFPMVPGHEIVGIVTAVGSKVTKFKVGDRAGVGCFVDSCTTCATRDLDLEHYMPGLVVTYNGVEADGKTLRHRCFAPASRSIRRCATGRPVPARRSRSSAWAVSDIWASSWRMPWAQT